MSTEVGPAWAEAEAALPEKYVIGFLMRTAPAWPERWRACAYRDNGPKQNYGTVEGESAATPAEALRNLSAALESAK